MLGFQIPGGQPLVPVGHPRPLASLYSFPIGPHALETFVRVSVHPREGGPSLQGWPRTETSPWPVGGAVLVGRTWRFWFPPARMAPSQLELNSEERKRTALPSTPTHYQQQTEDWAGLGRPEQVHPDRIRRPGAASHRIPSGPTLNCLLFHCCAQGCGVSTDGEWPSLGRGLVGF